MSGGARKELLVAGGVVLAGSAVAGLLINPWLFFVPAGVIALGLGASGIARVARLWRGGR